MDRYTELALESAEGAGSGVTLCEKRMGRHIKRICFVAEQPFGRELREKGRYFTLLTEKHPLENEGVLRAFSAGIARTLSEMVEGSKKRILAVGLGNPSAVVDALGAETVKYLCAGKRSVTYLATLTPSVFGVTGLETAAVIKGVAREYKPDIILCVDTLATRRAERLFRAVQIGQTIVPGGGVGNQREALTEQELGAPLLTVGVPLLAHAERLTSLPTGLVVTPKEIDLVVPAFAKAIAAGVESGLCE